MPLRFVDLDNRPSGYDDFVRRKRTPTLVEQFVVCFAFILTGLAVVIVANDKLWLTALLFTVIGLASFYVNYRTYKSRELAFKTELQNAILASALSKGYLWCLIASQRNGEIIYRNSDFGTWFPAIRAGNSLAEWLAAAGVPSETAIAVIKSIGDGQDVRSPLVLRDTPSGSTP